jgi:hypothetical protein
MKTAAQTKEIIDTNVSFVYRLLLSPDILQHTIEIIHVFLEAKFRNLL